MLLYARASGTCIVNLAFVGAILQEREDAIARVDVAREWLLAHAPAEPTDFGVLLKQATDALDLEIVTVLAALWDLISSHRLELMAGSRVRAVAAP